MATRIYSRALRLSRIIHFSLSRPRPFLTSPTLSIRLPHPTSPFSTDSERTTRRPRQPFPPSTDLNHYTATLPPTATDLYHASRYFRLQKPDFLFSAPRFSRFPTDSLAPEVAFLGRSNVGKSSLLNALFNIPRTEGARTSQRPGRTREMNVFQIGARGGAGKGNIARGGVVVVDCPGYGFASREEWGTEMRKYLQGRKQLRRAFVLVDAEHGLKSSDRALLTMLRDLGTPHQIVLAKVDKWLSPRPRRLTNEKFAEKGLMSGRLIGVDEVRWAVLQAAGLDAKVDLEGLTVLEEEGGESEVQEVEREEREMEEEKRLVEWEGLGEKEREERNRKPERVVRGRAGREKGKKVQTTGRTLPSTKRGAGDIRARDRRVGDRGVRKTAHPSKRGTGDIRDRDRRGDRGERKPVIRDALSVLDDQERIKRTVVKKPKVKFD
ncbi:hypothetical protein EJ06DRAFT_412170 [Trichodelitschia bisporula]|uniref:GTP-binding protein 8 n=1 Tax=Trichodelitschia bisporula TaxID=703511 RepID=A0A6G1HXU7_9PEZI|nr:hypothetical protein EJ06DRAFT_412170 [Trichodelitschia bisporula]